MTGLMEVSGGAAAWGVPPVNREEIALVVAAAPAAAASLLATQRQQQQQQQPSSSAQPSGAAASGTVGRSKLGQPKQARAGASSMDTMSLSQPLLYLSMVGTRSMVMPKLGPGGAQASIAIGASMLGGGGAGDVGVGHGGAGLTLQQQLCAGAHAVAQAAHVLRLLVGNVRLAARVVGHPLMPQALDKLLAEDNVQQARPCHVLLGSGTAASASGGENERGAKRPDANGAHLRRCTPCWSWCTLSTWCCCARSSQTRSSAPVRSAPAPSTPVSAQPGRHACAR